jgi:hypothetical protein
MLLSVVENTAETEDVPTAEDPTAEDGDNCHVTDTTATPGLDG